MCMQSWRPAPDAVLPALLDELRAQLRAMTDFAEGRPGAAPPAPRAATAAGPETIPTVALAVACAGGPGLFRTAGAVVPAPPAFRRAAS